MSKLQPTAIEAANEPGDQRAIYVPAGHGKTAELEGATSKAVYNVSSSLFLHVRFC